MMGWLRLAGYAVEGVAARLALALFAALSLDRASALGGWLGRTVGPRLALSDIARRNLRHAFPDRSDAAIETIVRGMWDNLGRVAGEYPHLASIDRGGGRIELVGGANLEQLLQSGRGGIFFSAHLGNWEILPLAAGRAGATLTQIYRAANNPFVDRLIRGVRAPVGGHYTPKGATGAKQLIAALGRGEQLALLVDQKMNDGIATPFFGRDAMTAPALAQLALKFDCPVVPARVERIAGARFRLTIDPPLNIARTGDRAADVAETMRRVNAILEDWIRDRPEQWLWLHRRWPD